MHMPRARCIPVHSCAGPRDACLRCRYARGEHTTDQTTAVQESHRHGRYFFGEADKEANECVDLSANGVCNEAERLPTASDDDAFRAFDYDDYDAGDCPCGTDPTDCGERAAEDCGYATAARFGADAHAGALAGQKVVPNDNSCRGADIPPIMSFEVRLRPREICSSSAAPLPPPLSLAPPARTTPPDPLEALTPLVAPVTPSPSSNAVPYAQSHACTHASNPQFVSDHPGESNEFYLSPSERRNAGADSICTDGVGYGHGAGVRGGRCSPWEEPSEQSSRACGDASDVYICACGTDVTDCGPRSDRQCCTAWRIRCDLQLSLGIVCLVFALLQLPIMVVASVFATYAIMLRRECRDLPSQACLCGCRDCECHRCCQCCACC